MYVNIIFTIKKSYLLKNEIKILMTKYILSFLIISYLYNYIYIIVFNPWHGLHMVLKCYTSKIINKYCKSIIYYCNAIQLCKQLFIVIFHINKCPNQ